MFAQTWKGRYYNIVGYLLSFYCVYMILMVILKFQNSRAGTHPNLLQLLQAAVSILFDMTGKTDPVSNFLQLFATYFGVNIDLECWSQEISFVFVGLIILTSIRTFLMNLMKVSCSSSGLSAIVRILNIFLFLFSYFKSSP